MTDTATATPPPAYNDTTNKPPPPPEPVDLAQGNPSNPADPAASGAATGSEFQTHMASEASHAKAEDMHRANREADMADARNSTLPLTERLKAAGHAVLEGAKEFNEGGMRSRDAQRADEAAH